MSQILKQIIKPSTPLRYSSDETSPMLSECLYGETVEVKSVSGNFIFCKSLIDSYEGWVLSADVGEVTKKTHKIISLRTFVQNSPDVKSNIILTIPLGSKVTGKSILDSWLEITIDNYCSGFVPLSHVLKIDEILNDWVQIAELFVHTPYRWGGRNSLGIDCSALIQVSIQCSGIPFPRDTRDQEKFDWKIVNNKSQLKRGVLVFWKGHVGVMIDKNNILHANATSMSVKVEKLIEVVNRHKKNNFGEITKFLVKN